LIEILVLGEIENGEIAPITGELVGAAENLNGTVGLVLLGKGLSSQAQSAAILGAKQVFLAENEFLDGSSIDAYVEAFSQVCSQLQPKIILVGKTFLGQNVGPRVAFRLNAVVAQDCIEIGHDMATGNLVATRPVYGGNALAKVMFPNVGPNFIIVRGRVYEPAIIDESHVAEITDIDVEVTQGDIRVRHVESVAQDVEGIRLEDATIVVAGGRGLGGPEPFESLHELAALLGGSVGASRAACDAGWVDHSYQVGLTGKTITPELYITIGISGASQHMAGCSGARNIVVVNKDSEANIFKDATYGVVGDWNKILPAFIETVRELID